MDPTADIALMAELHDKITNRIREEIFICGIGFDPAHRDPEGTTYSASQVNDAFVTSVAMKLISHPAFVSNMTKAIAHKISHAQLY